MKSNTTKIEITTKYQDKTFFQFPLTILNDF